MRKYNIESSNIEFKNLFSGPAPIGRILNYIYLIGTTGLKHKNGSRTVYSNDGVGYAWTTEFMIGLGLVKLGDSVGTAIKLELTDSGERLFELIKNKATPFNDGFRDDDIRSMKKQICDCHPELYNVFKHIFMRTYPFLILKDYLNEKGYNFVNLRGFYDDFFRWASNLYGTGSEEGNAGFNRLPSLIQLCKLFELADTRNGIVFDSSVIQESAKENMTKEYTKEELKEAASKEQEIITFSTNELISTYGDDGNVLVSAIVRNSSLQAKFKHNLMIQQKGKCVICGMEHNELLIGSHIKSSAASSVVEKIDHNNGLLLCCNHDKLFDRYLITFDGDNGKIMISDSLSKEDIERLNIQRDFALPKSLLTEERKKYLKIHNSIYDDLEDERRHN